MSNIGFGVLLRARRRGAVLTQEELAERSGLSVRAIRDLERGRVARPRRETVRLLAMALGLGQDDHEELLRLARQAAPPVPPFPAAAEPPARPGPLGAAPPAPPVMEPPAGHDASPPAALPPAGPATPQPARAGGTRAGRSRGRRPAAGYALLLTAVLAVPVHSWARGPDTASPSPQHAPATRNASRAVSAAWVAGDDMPPLDPSSIGDDLQVLHPVPRGDALIVTVALTGAGAGPVTVTDTAANHYRAAGNIVSRDNRHRLLLFALMGAKPLDTLDQITVRWPRATESHTTVDAFGGITTAGPWGGSQSTGDQAGGSEPFTSGELPLCPSGDLLFTAVSTPKGTDAQLDSPWKTLTGSPLPGPPLTTAYRTITSGDDRCEERGSEPAPWQSISLRLH